jgi:hypothetical protein
MENEISIHKQQAGTLNVILVAKSIIALAIQRIQAQNEHHF